MATVRRLRAPEHPEHDGVLDRLTRLAQLEFELGLARTREVLVSALIAAAVAVPSAVAVIAAIVVLIAGALAPLFDARWEHLVAGGGGVLLLALAALGWSAYRLRHLAWPRETLTSIQETWRWLGAQLRSRLTSR
jgi:uncharacterized membrane protein YqjE